MEMRRQIARGGVMPNKWRRGWVLLIEHDADVMETMEEMLSGLAITCALLGMSCRRLRLCAWRFRTSSCWICSYQDA
jgi:hypothetical protein